MQTRSMSPNSKVQFSQVDQKLDKDATLFSIRANSNGTFDEIKADDNKITFLAGKDISDENFVSYNAKDNNITYSLNSDFKNLSSVELVGNDKNKVLLNSTGLQFVDKDNTIKKFTTNN